jgi:TPR repeat protein
MIKYWMSNMHLRNLCKLSPVVGMLLMSLVCLPVSAGWEEGLAASKAGDHQTAFEELMPLAEGGHGSAQSMIGVMYYNGEGVEQDFAAAAVWLNLAANQGYSVAQYNLGVMYDSGQGVEQDFNEAFKWYNQAARQGHANAQFNLGAMYSYGDGTEADPVRAHMWFNLASIHGNPDASQQRKQLEASMTQEQVRQAKRLAAACVDSKYKEC